MSNELIKGAVVFTCDAEDCGDTLETGELYFSAANAMRKAEGWIAFKDPDTDEWEHRCPTCRGR